VPASLLRLVQLRSELVLAARVLDVEQREVRGETLVQPQVRPVGAGEQVAEPLMSGLVRDQEVGRLVGSGALVREQERRERGGRDVLHAAPREVVHRGLAVLREWVRARRELRHERQDLVGLREGRREVVREVRLRQEQERHVPGPPLLERQLARHQSEQVARVREAHAPLLHAPASDLVCAHALAGRDGDPVGGQRQTELDLGALRRLVEAREPTAAALRLPVGEDQRRTRAVEALAGEPQPALGSARVADGELVPRAGAGRAPAVPWLLAVRNGSFG
jgi:hypothetical protein